MKSLVLSLLASVVFILHLNAQSLITQTRKELLDDQISRLTAVSTSDLEDPDSFINGILSVPVANNYVHPYFIDNSWRNGMVIYRGVKYDTGMLKYDISRDCIVYLYTLGHTSYPVSLNKDFIHEFELDDHRFIFLNDFREGVNEKLKTGYYERIYDGKTNLYLRRQKLANLHTDISDLKYTEWTYLFLKKNGIYHRITGKASLLRVLGDRRKEIRAFIRNNDLVSCTKNNNSLVRILEYYDNL